MKTWEAQQKRHIQDDSTKLWIKLQQLSTKHQRNSKMILDQMSRNEVLVNVGTESKNGYKYKMSAKDEMTKNVTVQEDKPMIAHLLDLTNDAEKQYYEQLDEQNKMLENNKPK